MMWAYLTSHTWGRKDRTLSRGRSETTGVKTSGDCPAAEDPVKGSTHECKQPSPTFLPPSEVQARLWRTAAVSLNTSLPFTALWTAIKVSSIHPRAWGSLRPPLSSRDAVTAAPTPTADDRLVFITINFNFYKVNYWVKVANICWLQTLRCDRHAALTV